MENIFKEIELSLATEVPLQLSHEQVKMLWQWMQQVSKILRFMAEVDPNTVVEDGK